MVWTYRYTACDGTTADWTHTYTVSDNIAPTITTCPANQTFCSIPSGNYTIPQIAATDNCIGALTYSYTITGATNRIGIGADASGSFGIGLSTITWTVTDICGNDSANCITTVTVNETPTITLVSTTCAPSLLTYDVSFTSTTGVITTTAGTVSGNTITGIPAGTNITITSNNNGCTSTLSVTAPVCECPTIAAATNPNNPTICFGVATPALTVNEPGAGFEANWFESAIGGTAIATNATSFTPTNTAVGTYPYYVEVVQTVSGCLSARVPVTLTINPTPTAAQMNIHSNSPICSGNTLNLYANGGTDYEWSGPTYAAVFQNPVRTNATTQMSGDYTVTVTDILGCSSTATINVVINPLPIPSVGSNSPVCAGDTISLTSGGGTTYSWGGSGSFISLSQNPFIFGATLLNSGTYTVTVTGVGGCTSTAQTGVTVIANPTVSPTSNSPICDGTTLNLSAGGTGTSYSWVGSSLFTSTLQNPAIVGATLSATGIYTVTITGTGSCTASASVSVNVNSNPVPIVSGDTAICPNESTTLTVSGGNSYFWSTNQTDISITVSPASTAIYTVTATDTNGCTQTTSVIVVRNSNPVIASVDSIVEACSAADGSITVNVTDGTQPYGYVWSNTTQNSPTISSLSAGGYSVTVTDAANCSVTQTISLSNSPAPELLPSSIIDDHCARGIGEATVFATGGLGNYTYTWDGLPQGSRVVNLLAGTYQVVVSDGRCTDTVNVTVNNIPGPTADFEPVPETASSSKPEFRFQNESVNANIYSWSFGDGNFSTEESPTHHYYGNEREFTVVLQVTDKYGCTDTASHVVKIIEDISIFIPNCFTPDDDGVNDVFKPSGVGYSLSGYEMVIYDRWGKQEFYSNQFDKGWDGRVNGKKLNVNAVFTYLIKIYDLKGKEYKYFGHVVVLGSDSSEY